MPNVVEGAGDHHPIQETKTSKPWVAKAGVVGTVALVLIGALAQFAGSHGLNHVGSLSMQSIQNLAEQGAKGAALFTLLAGSATLINEARKKAKAVPREEGRAIDLDINGKAAMLFDVNRGHGINTIQALENDFKKFAKSKPSEQQILDKLSQLQKNYGVDLALKVGKDLFIASPTFLIKNEQEGWSIRKQDDGKAQKFAAGHTSCILGSDALNSMYTEPMLKGIVSNINRGTLKEEEFLKIIQNSVDKKTLGSIRIPLIKIENRPKQ